MKTVTVARDIITLRPEKDDLLAGAKYAAITLPWTFNRMMMNTSSAGQQSRALNIAKGVVGQEMLRRYLAGKGVEAEVQRKSHRDDDLFDFRLQLDGDLVGLDIKTINHYTNYKPVGRDDLSTELIVKNRGYAEADWRRFFPMLVPHTQINQSKEAFCFAIGSSIDFRKDALTDRVGYALTSFPYGESVPFYGSPKLCLAREAEGKGIFLELNAHDADLLGEAGVSLTVIGEWAGKIRQEKVALGRNKRVRGIGPFSSVLSFQMDEADYRRFNGVIDVFVNKNQFNKPVLGSGMRDINVMPDEIQVLDCSGFCNLVLPSTYLLYVVGWITKDRFLERCRDYTGWVWPIDRDDRFKNTPWDQLTDRDWKTIEKAGFGDCIDKKSPRVKAGFMKTHGRGGGACCFVYPNIGANGGVKETNLYVLPQDLRVMSEIGLVRR
jgi:hypothetical protein